MSRFLWFTVYMGVVYS